MPNPYAHEHEQLALFELAARIPSWPRTNTLAGIALDAMLNGTTLDHPSFERITGSWRLAAVIFELRALGWPIRSRNRPAQPGERAGIAVYSLSARALATTFAARRPD